MKPDVNFCRHTVENPRLAAPGVATSWNPSQLEDLPAIPGMPSAYTK